MARAYSYKPRFIDIRVRPPDAEPRPEERVCDWAGCGAPGVCKAPMGPDKLNEHYWFCPAHAAQYNKNWNFFADMTEAEMAAYQAAASTGHRPTWGSSQRINGRTGAKFGFDAAFADTFGFFTKRHTAPDQRGQAPKDRRLGRLEQRALETLGLDAHADAAAVRQRYAELVKRFHPDANSGDRTSEGRLQQVIHAYKTLKKAGYV